MMKYFCFRFDVDTHRCLTKGIPNLIKLAKELDVSFTFFVHMGRATSQLLFIKSFFAPQKGSRTVKLSNLKKLGLGDYATIALFNPLVGGAHPQVIKQLHQAGHEVGLHGGLNHAKWQHYGATWPQNKLTYEINGALKTLSQAGIENPHGFSSPGWQGSPALNNVLEKTGFRYVADNHQADMEEITAAASNLNLVSVPTNIAGEPGGIGYIEHLKAQGLSDKKIIEDFTQKLEQKKALAIVYDHPYYAGVQTLPLIKEMILTARARGFKILPIRDIIQQVSGKK